MGKKLLHASHFAHSLKKRSPKRFQRIRSTIEDGSLRVNPKNSQRVHNNKRLAKYWRKRNLIFSKINENRIYLTDELWYSVTPEVMAIFLARFVKSCIPNAKCILDIFCGGGGNTIQFAKLFPKVIGLDYNLEHLYCTAMNSKAYGVQDRVWLRYGKWSASILKDQNVDCIFASPPWGGPEYINTTIYDLENSLKPMGITKLLETCKKVSKNSILFLPKNSDLYQLANATRTVFGEHAKCKVLYVKEDGYTKGMCCMWGDDLLYYKTDRTEVELNDVENLPPNSKDTTSNIDFKEVEPKIMNDSIYDIDG